MRKCQIALNISLIAAILFALPSCRREEPEEPGSKTLTPEAFFAASIEFSDLNVEFKTKSLAILEKYTEITPQAHEELRTASEDARKKHQAVMDKYGLSGPDWAGKGPAGMEREEYLKQHPEIRQRLDENRKKILELARKIEGYTVRKKPPASGPAQ